MTHRIMQISILLALSILLTTDTCADQPSDNFQIIHQGSGISLHKEMFMLPVTYSDEYNGKQTEVVFQLSAKHRLFDTRFYFAYTQISFWQAYDHNNSAPFRETNYNPEIFYRSKTFLVSAGNIGADVGFEHESNGQKPPVSRSWNLIYLSPYFYSSNTLIFLKFRYRIPEDEKEFPESAVGDDNPDITDYLGFSDIHVFYKFLRNQRIHLTLRGNFSTGKGGISLNYSFPVPKGKNSFFSIRVSEGYGESLVDYKKPLTRVGLGIMFNR